jgi:lipid-A-disaccharide synthase
MDKEVVKELIQDDLNYLQLRAELDKILHGSKNRKLLLDEYHQLQEVLGPKGASKRTAIAIYKYKKS